jgi:hypothetical protein
MWHRDFIAEQHDAIAVYLRWRNQHATPVIHGRESRLTAFDDDCWCA